MRLGDWLYYPHRARGAHSADSRTSESLCSLRYAPGGVNDIDKTKSRETEVRTREICIISVTTHNRIRKAEKPTWGNATRRGARLDQRTVQVLSMVLSLATERRLVRGVDLVVPTAQPQGQAHRTIRPPRPAHEYTVHVHAGGQLTARPAEAPQPSGMSSRFDCAGRREPVTPDARGPVLRTRAWTVEQRA
jgi:hypothetical protein